MTLSRMPNSAPDGRRGANERVASLLMTVRLPKEKPLPSEAHVLLVDEHTCAGHLAEDLHAAGFGVTWLIYGWPGESGASEDAPAADVVILQVPPGGRLSFETLATAAARVPGRPIVVVGDRAAAPFIEEAMNWGADDYILSPYAAEELSLRIIAVLRRWRARRDELDEQRRATIRVVAKTFKEKFGTANEHLSTMAFYCGLLSMIEELPEDSKACLRHLAGTSAALNTAVRDASEIGPWRQTGDVPRRHDETMKA